MASLTARAASMLISLGRTGAIGLSSSRVASSMSNSSMLGGASRLGCSIAPSSNRNRVYCFSPGGRSCIPETSPTFSKLGSVVFPLSAVDNGFGMSSRGDTGSRSDGTLESFTSGGVPGFSCGLLGSPAVALLVVSMGDCLGSGSVISDSAISDSVIPNSALTDSVSPLVCDTPASFASGGCEVSTVSV